MGSLTSSCKNSKAQFLDLLMSGNLSALSDFSVLESGPGFFEWSVGHFFSPVMSGMFWIWRTFSSCIWSQIFLSHLSVIFLVLSCRTCFEFDGLFHLASGPEFFWVTCRSFFWSCLLGIHFTSHTTSLDLPPNPRYETCKVTSKVYTKHCHVGHFLNRLLNPGNW